MGDLQRSESEVTGGAPAFATRLRCAVLITLYAALTYGTTNALAHARGTTTCIALPWEMHLPLVTWLVVPYLLVDCMVALSALWTVSHGQLRNLMRRLFWLFTVGNLIFLVWPLRCDFPRTIPDDWTAPLFHLLHFSDLPYNQAPSLHIAEAVVIAPVYLARWPHPAVRTAFLAVIVLGSAGTVLTYQHHVLDVVTGLIFGLLVLLLLREQPA
jgi:membrane-associated phospholipid phosphatase